MIGIAIVLLIIIAFIIWFVLQPIRYECNIITRHPRKVEFTLGWMGKLFYLHIGYIEGEPFVAELYLLWKARLGKIADYEEWLTKRIEKEADESLDKKKSTAGTYNETETVMQGEKEEALSSVEPVQFTLDGQVIEKSKPNKSLKERLHDKKEAFKAKKEALKRQWWMKHLRNKDLYRVLLIFMSKCLHHSKPSHVFVEGKFGNGDPYKMGLYSALLYSVCPDYLEDVELSYTEKTYEGSLTVNGEIIPVVMAYLGTRLIITKPMRAFLGDAAKFAKELLKKHRAKKKAEKEAMTKGKANVA